MARTAHNRRLHRKKQREPRGEPETPFVPVADDMMRRLREQSGEPAPAREDADPCTRTPTAAGGSRP